LEILKQQIILSNREKFDIFEIRRGHRLKFFSYTYRMSDKYGIFRPIIRWDNHEGRIHYDTFNINKQISLQKECEYKEPAEILRLIRIFKHNLAIMDIDKL
jgi:hypothetical protein